MSQNSIDKNVVEIIARLRNALNELDKIQNDTLATGDFKLGDNMLKRWKRRTAEYIRRHINTEEGSNFENLEKTWGTLYPDEDFRDEVHLYRSALASLINELGQHPEETLFIQEKRTTNTHMGKEKSHKKVFIIHGYDETNLHRLEKILKEHFHLEPIILRYEPGKGRTLIEKFEEEAPKSTYAFALFTPDDLVELSEGKYLQARPNVIFEIGWFYGRLGRQNVCILFQKGTRIHSDLDGINRIEFIESVEEKILDIERELKAVELI